MDEEQSKNKIDVNSFFERVDSVEKVAGSALSKSNSVMGVANANKLLIESLQFSVEAMQTQIRDIANYIVIEKKLEKDLKEDRLLEEQDAQQKKDFENKLLGLKGPAGPQGPQGTRGEDFGSKGGGGSFLGGLLKGLATLGAGAFALKFMWPALLPVIKGAIGSAVSGGIKFLGGAVGKTLIGILGGIPIVGAAAKLIGGGIERTANKAGDGLEKTIKNMGEDGKVDVPTYTGGGGRNNPPKEVDKEVEPEKKEVDEEEIKPEKKENKVLEFVKKGGVAGYLGRKVFGDKKEVDEEEIKPEKKENKLLEFVKGGGLAGMAYRKVFGKDEKKKLRDKDGRYIGDHARKKNFQDNMDSMRDKASQIPMETTVNPDGSITSKGSGTFIGGELVKPGEPLTPMQRAAMTMGLQMGNTYSPEIMEKYNNSGGSPSKEEFDNYEKEKSEKSIEPVLESDDVGSLETPDKVEMGNSTNVTEVTIPPTPPPVNNSTPLVQAKPPQVSEVDIKVTEAPIPFRKLISSKKYLSVSDMNKSGLPPEIAKMIS